MPSVTEAKKEEDKTPVDPPKPTPEEARLTITSLRRDFFDRNVTLNIDVAGALKKIPWPKKDEAVTVDGVCNTKDTAIKLTTTHDDSRHMDYSPTNSMCFVGKSFAAGEITVGFEHDCSAMDYNFIDDTIATFKCPKGKVSIKDLRLDPNIDLVEWLK